MGAVFAAALPAVASILGSLIKKGGPKSRGEQSRGEQWGTAVGDIGGILSGGAQGAASERDRYNQFQQNQNAQAANLYGTNQRAILEALLGRDRGLVDRYQTQQQATTNALANASDEATRRYGTRQGAMTHALDSQSAEAIQRAKLGMEAPGIRAKQSILGSLMQNMQPVSISGGNARVLANMPTISGGLTPAALDPTTREHGGALLRAALLAQLSGSDVPAATDFRGGVLDAPAATDFRAGILRTPDMPDYSGAVLTPPTLGGYRQPGKGESWSSGGGIVGGILGALLPAIINRRPSKTDPNFPG